MRSPNSITLAKYLSDATYVEKHRDSYILIREGQYITEYTDYVKGYDEALLKYPDGHFMFSKITDEIHHLGFYGVFL